MVQDLESEAQGKLVPGQDLLLHLDHVGFGVFLVLKALYTVLRSQVGGYRVRGHTSSWPLPLAGPGSDAQSRLAAWLQPPGVQLPLLLAAAPVPLLLPPPQPCAEPPHGSAQLLHCHPSLAKLQCPLTHHSSAQLSTAQHSAAQHSTAVLKPGAAMHERAACRLI